MSQACITKKRKMVHLKNHKNQQKIIKVLTKENKTLEKD